MPFDPPRKIPLTRRAVARVLSSPFVADRVREFRNIIVHPTQEMRDPDGAFFRGGPEWPRFAVFKLGKQGEGGQPFSFSMRHIRGCLSGHAQRRIAPCPPDTISATEHQPTSIEA